MTQKSEMPTLAGLAKDMAFLVSAPAGADLSRLQGALRILIEMTRYQEREACAKVCERIGGKMTDDCDGAQPGFWPDQVAHRCATEIMMRPNAELRGRPLADGPA